VPRGAKKPTLRGEDEIDARLAQRRHLRHDGVALRAELRNARIRPSRTCGMTATHGPRVKSVCPAITEVTAGAAPWRAHA
jgi:hypothetical protein